MKTFKRFTIRLCLLACCLFLAGCEDELLKSLDQRQANEVLAALQQANIPAEKRDEGKAGFSVYVQKSDFAAAVSLLKAHDLPSKARIEISDMFPADSLATSPRSEKARLNSAIEQRLEQSLLVLPSVVQARLHVSYDVEGASGRQQANPSHISALIVYQHAEDEAVLINQIKRFLKNSLTTVNYDDISVVLTKKPDTLQHLPQYDVPKQQIGQMTIIGGGVVLVLVVGGLVLLFIRKSKQKSGNPE
jgi:type III secretion system inner membrane ring protein